MQQKTELVLFLFFFGWGGGGVGGGGGGGGGEVDRARGWVGRRVGTIIFMNLTEGSTGLPHVLLY